MSLPQVYAKSQLSIQTGRGKLMSATFDRDVGIAWEPPAWVRKQLGNVTIYVEPITGGPPIINDAAIDRVAGALDDGRVYPGDESQATGKDLRALARLVIAAFLNEEPESIDMSNCTAERDRT